MKNKKLISVFFSMLLAYGVSAAGSSTDLPNIEVRLLSGEQIPCEQKEGNYCVDYEGKRLIFPVNSVNGDAASRVLLKKEGGFYCLELIKNPDNKTASIVKYEYPFTYDPTEYDDPQLYMRDPTEQEMRFYLELLKDGFIVPQDYYSQEYYDSIRIFGECIQCFNGLKIMFTGQEPRVPYNFSRDPHFINFLNFCNYYIRENLIQIIPLVEEYIDYIPGLSTRIMSLRVIEILRTNPDFVEKHADKLFYVDKPYQRYDEKRGPESIHSILTDQTTSIERKIELLTEYNYRLYTYHGANL